MPGVCHRCKRNVYVADEKVALGRVWHNFCVSCRKCRKLLDECSAKLYQDEIYCRKCYGVLCGGSDEDDEDRRCGGRRGGCCRRCPTPARIPARSKPSPTAVTTWYSRGHSTQPCKACPRCSAKEPWLVCEGGSQRCPNEIGCKRRSRARTKTSTCDESCPARESLESVASAAKEKVSVAPKVKKASSPTCVCCNCCAPERSRRKSCCRRCLRREKEDEKQDSSSRGRRSCDRSTCCAWKARRRATSPCSTEEPPCIPCPPPRKPCLVLRLEKEDDEPEKSRGRRSCDRSTCCAWKARRRSTSPCSCSSDSQSEKDDEERESRSRRRRSCDRSTCCAWKARRRASSPCSRADPPCVPCPPPRRKTPEPPCAPYQPCSPCPPCAPCPVLPPKTPDPPCKPCPAFRRKTPEPCPALKSKADGVEVLCPPAGSCRCSCCCSRRRRRSGTSSERASKASSSSPCPTAKPRRTRNDLPIGKPCRRCGRQVYHAELVLAAGTVFHTCCFSCRQCRKPLESTTVCEAQNEIFCKQCYLKRFGPSGYGYGLGAGALQTP